MIPPAIARALTLPRLETDAFAATPCYSAEDNAKFGNHLLRFIAEQYPRHLFTKSFCRLLSNQFGHIAHYSEHGFCDNYFTNERTKAEPWQIRFTGGLVVTPPTHFRTSN